jgi:hypothetical protein
MADEHHLALEFVALALLEAVGDEHVLHPRPRLGRAFGSHCHERSSITLSAVRSVRSRPRRTLFASPVVLSVMPCTM